MTMSENRVSTFQDHAPGSPGGLPADVRSSLTGGGRDLGGEIGFLLLNALTKCVANESRDLDRFARSALGFLERLRYAFLVVENERLLQQAYFLVERL